jgi:deoxyribodipyrimidine photolyase-related protein
LYWDFLARHEALLKRNPRMALPLKNLTRLQLSETATEPDGTASAERQALHARAIWLKANLETI